MFLHADIDPDDEADIEGSKARALKALNSFNPPPTWVVDSGSGIHAGWKLAQPVPISNKADRDKFEACNKVLEKRFTKSLQTWNLNRLLGLPGTWNHPNERKRAKGRKPTLRKLLEFHPDRVYTLSQFGIVSVPIAKPVSGMAASGTVDRSSKNFDYIKHCINIEKLDDAAIAARLLDPKYEYGEKYRERPNSEALALADIARVRGKCDKAAIILWKKEKNESLDLVTDQATGNPITNRPNLRTILKRDKVKVWLNVFTNEIHTEGIRGFEKPCQLTDPSLRRLRFDVKENYFLDYGITDFRETLSDIAVDTRVHPVLDYLDALTWDGVPRIDKWLTTYCGAKDTPYTRAVGRIHLTAAVHRVRCPGCKYDTILVLVGKQGTGKSTAIGILAIKREWFLGDMSLTDETKKIIENLQGKWIIETAEMKGNYQEEINKVKSLLSRSSDKARLSYARYAEEAQRQSVFFGSTNNPEFLYDPTGNRRFWPVDVKEIDRTALKRDVDQLWAEAVQAEKGVACDDDLFLPDSLWNSAAAEQEQHAENSYVYHILQPLLQGLSGKIESKMLWKILGCPEAKDQSNQIQRLRNQAMLKLGWKMDSVSVNGKVRRGFSKRSTPGGSLQLIEFMPDQRGDWILDPHPKIIQSEPPIREIDK